MFMPNERAVWCAVELRVKTSVGAACSTSPLLAHLIIIIICYYYVSDSTTVIRYILT